METVAFDENRALELLRTVRRRAPKQYLRLMERIERIAAAADELERSERALFDTTPRA